MDTIETFQRLPEYNSPLSGNSVFGENDETYVPFVNFKKLIPAIASHKEREMAYYYKTFESKATIPIGDPFMRPGFPIHRKEEEEDEEESNSILDMLEDLIPPLFPDDDGIRVDREYKNEKGQLVFFDGKLNINEGVIKIDKAHIGFLFELDTDKEIIRFADYFHYTDEEKKTPLDRVAIVIEARDFNDYKELCRAEGLHLSNNSVENITKRFTEELDKARNKPTTMAWLYRWMPDFVFLKRDKKKLINDLSTLLLGSVKEKGYKYINEEAIVLKILNAFATGKREDHDFLLSELTRWYIGKKTIFEVLYDKMNDVGGAPNFTAVIRLLYLIWGESTFANPATYTYSGQPETLAYQSKKILGFYSDAYSFEFKGSKLFTYEKTITHYKTGNKEEPDGFRESNEFRAAYDIYQPIQLPELDQKGEILMPDTLIPAFYLKAFDDKNAWRNFEKNVWLVVDIVTTASGFGNLLKLRYLAHLPKWARVLRLSFGVVELSSGIMSTMLTFVNSCDDRTSFCAKLKNYLNWLNLCAGAADIGFSLIEKKLRQKASEALNEIKGKPEKALSNEEKQIKKHLKEASGAKKGIEWLSKKIFNFSEDSAALKNFIRLLERKEENIFNIVAHGSKNGKKVDYLGSMLNAEEYAKIIRSEGWIEGTSVRLVCCHSGSLNNGFAKRLAKELNVSVFAPTKKVAVIDGGEFIHEAGGKFIEFKP